MKKNMTRISAILMAGMLASGVAVTPVFAEEKTTAASTQSESVATTETTTEKKTETTTEKPTTTEKKKTTTEKKKNTEKSKKKDKKKDDKEEAKDDGLKDIKAPEETKQFTVASTTSMIQKITKQIKKKQSYYDSYSSDVAVMEFYKKLADLKSEHGVTMDISLTGVKKDKCGVHTSDTVNTLLMDLATKINSQYLKDVLKEYNFQITGEVNVSTAMTDASHYLNVKPYIDKLLSNNTKPLDQKKAEMKKLKAEIDSLKKDRDVLKKNRDRMFNPMNLLQKSNLSTQEIQYMLQGSALESLASSFKKCEDTYGVNAVFVASIAIHESAWGTSRRAKEDNNLTGYGVTSDAAKGINAQTKEENLLMTAKLLKEKYLVEEGAYYHGPSVKGVNQCYCVGNTWAGYVTNYAYQLMDRLQSKEK
ncbi:MAG: glucosaminidase domain-containing protein [Anaerostipes sp.]|nr:glucosaminidase domain-containing protein [Anaerostipes sp.]